MTTSDTGYELEEERRKLHIIEWNHLDLWKFYPMALASSWTVRGLLYPMSVVKSRLQLQRQNNVYTGMFNAFSSIVKTEGFAALYRGFWVTVPQISASFIYSSVYEKLRDVMVSQAGFTSAPLVSAMAGGAASTCTQLIFVPTDIVAQYMMVYNNPSSFTGERKTAAVIDALYADDRKKRLTLGLRVIRAIYKVDGAMGFYRGFFSSLMLYIPSSMVFWSSYYNMLTLLKELRLRYTMQRAQLWKDNKFADGVIGMHSGVEMAEHRNDVRGLLLLQAISGAFGGVCAAIFTNPLEIMRIRIQVHRTSFTETLRRLVKFEGLRVFSKGLAPRVISNCIYSCLIMIGYETVKRTCVLPEYKDSVVW